MIESNLSLRRWRRRLSIAAVLSVAGIGGAWAQAASRPAARPLNNADMRFVQRAAQSSLAEVAMGRAAADMATHGQVKVYAQRMVDDHSRANDELRALVSARGGTVPAEMDRDDQQAAQRLSAQSGAAFDRAYMQHMVEAHEKAVGLFQEATRTVRDDELRQWAAQKLPTLQEHLRLARDTADQRKREKP